MPEEEKSTVDKILETVVTMAGEVKSINERVTKLEEPPKEVEPTLTGPQPLKEAEPMIEPEIGMPVTPLINETVNEILGAGYKIEFVKQKADQYNDDQWMLELTVPPQHASDESRKENKEDKRSIVYLPHKGIAFIKQWLERVRTSVGKQFRLRSQPIPKIEEEEPINK